ncbi:MAG TPA: DNA topoisomerase IB [Methylomirabilota bacterium]
MRTGRGFWYRGDDGAPVRDLATRRRIRALAIPPAWTDVWICPSPEGHIQAVGRDARGRKQYRYHARWRETRDATKYARLLMFAGQLPAIRRRVDADLARPGLPREKVVATAVRLLETSLIRVGNPEYAAANGSFGLTTLRNRHVKVARGSLRFEFRGKGGKRHVVDVADRRLARIVRQCQELPGYELFQYVDDAGQRHAIGSGDVNAYLRDVAGQDFTAKDFRTWAGTVLAARSLRGEAFDSETDAKRRVVSAIRAVAIRLGNTAAVSRKCYVHPSVVDAYLDGTLERITRRATRGRRPSGLDADERAVLPLLRARKRREMRSPGRARARQIAGLSSGALDADRPEGRGADVADLVDHDLRRPVRASRREAVLARLAAGEALGRVGARERDDEPRRVAVHGPHLRRPQDLLVDAHRLVPEEDPVAEGARDPGGVR